jgi:DNA-binding NtrC family response regulator
MVLLDVRLPGMSGIEALREIRARDAELPVLLITAHADIRQAVSAVKSGADDYLAKPVDLQELHTAIADVLGTSDEQTTSTKLALPDLPEGFICVSPALRDLLQTVAVVAPSKAPVLITGESGTGKERIAELIHRWSPRGERLLVTANCGGLPESLIESELFGHTKGAFTGAAQSREGVFRVADRGTLFLDEIGELPLHLQPKLLRVLESGEIRAVGSDESSRVDVRLIAATHADLERAVEAGQFREDLYYRINVIELRVPALRERRDDILPLSRAMAADFAGAPIRLSPQATQCLLSYAWPGNVRELRNAMQRACLLCRGDIVMPEHLPPKIAALAGSAPADDTDDARLAQVERATILATLQECQGNRTQAAKKLGISRRTLLYKLRAMESSRLQDD